MPETSEIVLRLCVATVVGALIGINRELYNHAIGVRTLGLVGLGAALAVIAVAQRSDDATTLSRVIQGVITGIGFLGAGVILRGQGGHVHGLTTAATIWVTSALGVLCGMGAWRTVAVAVLLVLALLTLGGPFERWLHRGLDSDVVGIKKPKR
jgi:putative Mg2+ transporter-C (MgtC) family protein